MWFCRIFKAFIAKKIKNSINFLATDFHVIYVDAAITSRIFEFIYVINV